ncbi:MAG: glycosyltransferase family 9 protein [Acidobacteriota bacterium]|nr:glycosyltransferase family 9 protein [Acidobacteriota bacterium]
MPPSLDPSRVQRVLVYRLGSLGDMLVALPSFHLVARVFPAAERRLLTNVPVHAKAAPAASILGESGLVHGYMRYAVGTRNPWQLATLWWQIRSWKPDVLVYLGSARGQASAQRDARFFAWCGIAHQIGVPVTEAMQQNWLDPQTELYEFEAARLARNVHSLGDAQLDDPASWSLRLTPAEQQRAAEALLPAAGLPVLAASIGTKQPAKDWGRDNWRSLLGALASRYPGHGLALLGSPEESADSAWAAQSWQLTPGAGPVMNLCGSLTPRESAAVLARSRVFLGHDSGPMHLAAAVQTPCVAVFAARNKPRVWYPYGDQHRVLYHRTECWGCNLEVCTVEQKRCLLSITVAEVLAQASAVLDAPPACVRPQMP